MICSLPDAIKGLLFVLLTLFLCVAGAFQLRADMCNIALGDQARDWPSTSGKIAESRIVIHQEDGGKMRIQKYQCHVRYTYTVKNRKYEADRVSFATAADHATTDYVLADKVQALYKPGTPVKVFYNPRSPSMAVLIPGVDLSNSPSAGYGVFLLGIVCTIIALTFCFTYPEGEQRNERLTKLGTIVVVSLILLCASYFAYPLLIMKVVRPASIINQSSYIPATK